MDTMLYQILDRSRAFDIEIAQLEHFSLDAGQPVSAQILLDEAAWSPYRLDLKQRQAIFVEIPPEVDLSQAVFAHLEQFRQARRVLVVPLDALLALAPQVELPPKLIFQFNIARCGTTLLNRVVNQVEGVWSFSEPDIFADHYFLSQQDYDEDELVALTRVCTGLLFRPPSEVQADTLGIKLRSQGLFMAQVFYKAFPQARYLFLYRDALSWTNSCNKFNTRIGRPPGMDDEAVTRFLWFVISGGMDFDYTAPYIDLDRAMAHLDLVFGPAWLLHCEAYVKHLDAGMPFFAFRYNELNSQRESVTAQLLAHCGLPADSLAAALRGFEGDAQEGTDIARSIKVPDLDDEHYEWLREIIARHPRFNDPDLLLPDIYHRDRLL